jgi:HAE1 family hydrophobic/amphiphilic exporter-1
MKSIIRWATSNAPAMNTLMIATLVVGAASMAMLRREVFPEFELEIVLVSVPYPGASPEEVEEGICQKIEEAVRAIDGVKRQTAIAKEGAGFLVLELEASSNVQKILNEVRSEVDAIPSFPELAEQPDVKQITYRIPAIRVGVTADVGSDEEIDRPTFNSDLTERLQDNAEWRLRSVAEKIRDDLVQLSTVSQADILGARDYQIDVEISESKLREHGLSLQEVARVIRRENVELPGGTMKTSGQDVLLRGKNKQLQGPGIAQLPVLNDSGGDVITVSDLGNVRDGFTDVYSVCEINGKPGLVISVNRTKSEDLLAMAAAVRDFVDGTKIPGYKLSYWQDQSIDVEDRMNMLLQNGLGGLALVFIVLAMFLDLRLAFWVALGIPVSVLGAGAVLLFGGQTLNMLSMFAFLMALGIVVDDAIVIGENIYKHREMGKPPVRAAIDGTYEVLPSVFASVCTTIIAFVPLMFVAGVMGKFFAVMPIAVIAMLIISLFESMFILPCHLSHVDSWIFRFFSIVLFPLRPLARLSHWLNEHVSRLLDWLINRTYIPSLNWSLRNPATVVALSVGLVVLLFGFINAGVIPFVVFPKLDTRVIEARISFPDGTPGQVTDMATRRMEESILAVNDRLGGQLIKNRYRVVGWMNRPDNIAGIGGELGGGHLGMVSVQLVSPEEREIESNEIVDMWREEWTRNHAAELPGSDSLVFEGEQMGPGGRPIEFKLLCPPNEDDFRRLEQAVEETKAKLATYEGVIYIEDDSRPGKWEYQIRINDDAKALGVTVADLAETVRAAYYGEEVMRLQRGRHEVKLMVRYPREERRSLAVFQDIRVRTNDGAERPITELADISVKRGYSEINRVDQRRAITIIADVQGNANARKVVTDLQANFMDDLLGRYPGVSVLWEGQQEQTTDSMQSLMYGFVIAVFAMYALLTVEFRSYFQPLLILAIVPFGFIGAALGHVVMGLEFTMLSMFGMIALTGVVVNDSIVLVDFINHRIEDGKPIAEALVEAGKRRFRPVILTSITTVAGLTPMLLETSFQGQILIPMATSLAFGLMVATALILILVPTFFSIYARVLGVGVVQPEAAESPVPMPIATPVSQPARPVPDAEVISP